MCRRKQTALTTPYKPDPIDYIENVQGIKLLEYQKQLIRMMLVNSQRKVMIFNGASVRRYYGYGKIAECYHLDERAQGR